MISNNPNIFAFYFLCISILTIPINIAFFNVIRSSDIFFMTSFMFLLCGNPKVESKYLFIFSAFFVVLLLSTYNSILDVNPPIVSRLGFFYKYSLIFLIPFLVVSLVINTKRLKKLVSLIYLIFISMIFWVYLYFLLRTAGFIQGNPRVSFPFSNYHIPDAHVYSSYLVFSLIAYAEYIRKVLNHGYIYSVSIILLGVIALFMTGSKTGILLIFIYIFIFMLSFLFSFKKSQFIKISSSLLLAIIIYNIYSHVTTDVFTGESANNIETLFTRTTQYNTADTSLVVRYEKLFKAINEIEKNIFLIGNGPTGARYKWYDGGLSILLAHVGVLGVSIFILYIFLFTSNIKIMAFNEKSKGMYKSFVLLLLVYILLSLITEHFLLTRNVLPAATILSIIYANIKINMTELSVMKYKYN